MSPSEGPRADRPLVGLTVTTYEDATELFLFDGRFHLLECARGHLNRTVPAGLYMVTARTGNATEERDLVLDGSQPLEQVEFGPLRYATAAPLRDTALHSLDLADVTRKTSGIRIGERIGDLYWCARLPVATLKDRRETVRPALIGWPPFTQGPSGAGPFLTPAVGAVDGMYYWLNSRRAASGPVSLKYVTPEGRVVERVVFIREGWQLQMFSDTQPLSDMPDDKVVIAVENFADAAVFYAPPGRGFEPNERQARQEDLTRLALAQGRLTLSKTLVETILRGEFGSPTLGLFGGHLCHRFRDQLGFPVNLSKVVDRLRQLLGMDHPDVAALALAAGELPSDYRFSVPPMLAASWQLILEATAKRPGLVPADSPAARIADRVCQGGPWLVWEHDGPLDTSALPPALRDWLAHRTKAAPPRDPNAAKPADVDPADVALIESLRRVDVTPADLGDYLGGSTAESARAGKVETAMPQLVRASGLPRARIETQLTGLLPEPKAGEFNPTTRLDKKILWYTPREAWESLWGLVGLPDFQLEAYVLGGGNVDPKTPSDLYATCLADGATAAWQWTTFTVEAGQPVCFIDLATGEDLLRPPAKDPLGSFDFGSLGKIGLQVHTPRESVPSLASFDAGTGVVRIYTTRLPLREWRLFALGQGRELRGTRSNNRVVFAVRREPAPPVWHGDAAGLVAAGHILAGWRAACDAKRKWTGQALSWLVATAFARMQVLLDEVIAAPPPVAAGCKFVLEDLSEIRGSRVDSLKQGVWDRFEP
jgi:hypothetical protein